MQMDSFCTCIVETKPGSTIIYCAIVSFLGVGIVALLRNCRIEFVDTWNYFIKYCISHLMNYWLPLLSFTIVIWDKQQKAGLVIGTQTNQH